MDIFPVSAFIIMRKIKEKTASLLLFAIAILWGNIWTTELLSCPEWWFIGVNALLFGAGIYLEHLLPDEWRDSAPAWLLALVLLIDLPVQSSVLMPIAAGCWYGSNAELYRLWQKSRTFCAGLLIGGIFAGIINELQVVPLILAVLIMLHCGIRASGLRLLDMSLLAIFYLCAQPMELPKPTPPEKIDTGTVITAFAMVRESDNEEDKPRIVFVGGNGESLIATSTVLSPAADIVFLPELPGTVPQDSDLIVVNRLPETGNSGMSSLVRSLVPGGVLVVPIEYCQKLPAASWYMLPGSENRYAVMSPGGDLEFDPDKLDDRFIRRYSMHSNIVPLGGALAGLLVDFKAQKIYLPAPEGKHFFRFFYYALGAGVLLLIIWCVRIRKGGRDNLRIFLNCAGFSLLTALLMPLALAGLPTVPAVTALLMVIALIWVFRRPVKWAAASDAPPKVIFGRIMPNWNSRLALSGIIAFIALLLSFNGLWIAALIALIAGGYFFAELDGELCGERDDISSEPVRFLGIAAGAFAAAGMIYAGFPILWLFLIVVILRGWSFFRS